MRKGKFKLLQITKSKNEMVEFEGTFENHGPLMIHKISVEKLYSITHIKSGGGYIQGLSLKQARSIAKQTKDYTCWKAKNWNDLERICNSRRWKGRLTRAIQQALETT